MNHPGSIKLLIVEPLVLMRDALTFLLQSVEGMAPRLAGPARTASYSDTARESHRKARH